MYGIGLAPRHMLGLRHIVDGVFQRNEEVGQIGCIRYSLQYCMQ